MTETSGCGCSLVFPQVKVCGLTLVPDAIACARAGADAVGLVFYPPSPRFVTERVAREISSHLPENVWPVGVFVDESLPGILRKVEACGLRGVQLHGREAPSLVAALVREGVPVIKSLFSTRDPRIEAASLYTAAAFLLEDGRGPLPGGNAKTWDWGSVRGAFGESCGELPCILAGGLDAGNVARAVDEVFPDAVDVSSGVESSPGKKDIRKVEAFLAAVRRSRPRKTIRRIFR